MGKSVGVQVVRIPPGNLQVAICFLRSSCTDPLEKQLDPLDPGSNYVSKQVRTFSPLSNTLMTKNLVTSSLTKFVRCAIYLRKMDAAEHLASNPYPSAIQGFVAYLIKDNALNDLCDKTLGILNFYSASKKR